ncbi:MAG: DNA double-strand break repair nuclease NurA [Desulfurococcales archaeon]|nr:DNA double-strand break repair nuclease NurA [Desulfurococcales archaeon]
MDLQRIRVTITKITSGTPRIKLIKQARIDYYIIDDQPQGPTKLIEHNHPIQPVNPPGETKDKHLIIGLDSSSSIIRTPFFNLITITASASSTLIPEVYDHPEIYTYQIKPRIRQPYIIVGTDTELPEEGEGVTTRNPLGSPYGFKYTPERIADEYRSWIENWMLSDPIHQATRKLEKQNYKPIILLDGPLYQTPQLIAKMHLTGEASSIWRRIVEDRINLIQAYEDIGIPVIGVVKRLEQSTILSHSQHYSKLVKGHCGVDLSYYSPPGDQALIHLLLNLGKCRYHIGEMMRTSILEYTPGGYGLPKLFTYIVIPPSIWSKRVSSYRSYRIEFTRKTMSILNGMNLTPCQVIYLETVRHALPIPFSIKLSDRRAGMLAQALRSKFRRMLSGMNVPFTYDELTYQR